MTIIRVQGRELRLTNLDKVYWPQTATTKGKMLEYYIKVAPLLLPNLQRRMVTLTRYPNGVTKKGFYQKNLPQQAPSWIETQAVHRSDGRVTNYVIVQDLPTLVWLANIGTIEFHPWLSSADSPDNPDYAVFDLDPMEKYGIIEVRQVAITIYQLLKALGLSSGIKTSGATGLQIFVPLKPIYSYTQVRDFVHAICKLVEQRHPKLTTLERSVNRRQGKIYLDYMQNAREKTIISAYSLRPRLLPTFSCPLDWQQVLAQQINPDWYTLERFLADKLPLNPWLTTISEQRLEQAVVKLEELM